MTLPELVNRRIRQHGGLRAASRATGIDAGYLARLRDGDKTSPSCVRLREIREAITPYPSSAKWLVYAEDIAELLAEVERVRSPEVRALVKVLRAMRPYRHLWDCASMRPGDADCDCGYIEDREALAQAADLLDAGEA